jgi:hypothetical protein
MSLKYFDSFSKFLENKTEAGDTDIKSKFLRRDPDKLIHKAKDNMYSLNFDHALELFSKAFRNAREEDKDEAVEEIMSAIDSFEVEKLPNLDDDQKEEFKKFEDDLDLSFIESDRKLKAALRKIDNAEDKITDAEEALKNKDLIKAAEYIKDAERKIDKAYFKKIEDSEASDEDKETVRHKIADVISKIATVQADIKEETENISDEAEKERVNKKLDKRELEVVANLEDPTLPSAAVGTIGTHINNTEQTTNEPAKTDDTVKSNVTTTSETEKAKEEDIVNKENVLQVALDPELYKNPKFKKTLNEIDANRLAIILWNAMDGLGTNEEILFNALRSPQLKNIADYSYLSDVYKKISAQKGDDPVQDLYLAIYDTLMGQTELTTSERDELADIILNKIKDSFKK